MKVFIGSSIQQESIAEEVAGWLEKEGIEANVWSEPGIFVPGQYTLDDLVKQSKSVDAAIFIFAEDDKIWYRNDIVNTVRDNVLFEYGLFCGRLSPENVIFIVRGEPKLATDIKGITFIKLNENKRDAKQRLLDWANRQNNTGKKVPSITASAANLSFFDDKGFAEQIYSFDEKDDSWIQISVDYSKLSNIEPLYSGALIQCIPHLNLSSAKTISVDFEFLDAKISKIFFEIKNHQTGLCKRFPLLPNMIRERKVCIDITKVDPELLKNVDEIVFCTNPSHFSNASDKTALYRIGSIYFL